MRSVRLILLLATVLVSACATQATAPYSPRGPESVARQITKAAGLPGLRDAAVPVDPHLPTRDGPVGMTLFTGVGNVLGVPYGFTHISAGLTGNFLDLLAPTQPPDQDLRSSYTHIIAWVPRSAASDGENAAKIARRLVEDEAWSVVSGAALPEGFSPSLMEINGRKYISVKGRTCSELNVTCSFAGNLLRSADADWTPASGIPSF